MPLPDAVNKMQQMREIANFAFPILSAARCKAHNTNEGGAEHSKHTYGMAFDIGVTGSRQYDILKIAHAFGFHGIGVAEEFIHIDIRSESERTIWTYPTKRK